MDLKCNEVNMFEKTKLEIKWLSPLQEVLLPSFVKVALNQKYTQDTYKPSLKLLTNCV